MQKISILGGGFGGIAAAIRMRAHGNEVTLFERLDTLGGRAQVFKGVAIHMMLAQQLLQRLFFFMSYLLY